MKKDTWLVVANSSLAHIYKLENDQTLASVQHLEHPESRLHDRDLVTDKPGRAFDSTGANRHSVEPPISPKRQEFIVFAKQISHFIEAARLEGKFKNLYIAASPNILGLIRENLPQASAQSIKGEIDKDLTHIKPAEIASHLPFNLSNL